MPMFQPSKRGMVGAYEGGGDGQILDLDTAVKSVKGSTAEELCALKREDVVELMSSVMENGFDISQIDPPEKFGTVIILATGSGSFS